MWYPGVPKIEDYRQSVKSPLFLDIESFSKRFVEAAKPIIIAAGWEQKWVLDPLHTYNRQWEYPFCIHFLQTWLNNQSDAAKSSDSQSPKLLDAGSGVTFMPDYLTQLGWSVTCCDNDQRLEIIFSQLGLMPRVQLDITDLTSLPYNNDTFDAIICVSVLEHLDKRNQVLDEVFRVLRPGGLFILTIDISLDNIADIPKESAQNLLRQVTSLFSDPAIDNYLQDLDLFYDTPERFLTTTWARKYAPELLPWRMSNREKIRSILHFRWPRPTFHPLSIFCLAIEKPIQDFSK